MSSNMGRTKALLGRYGLFQPGVLGNLNTTPIFPSTTQGQAANVIPANLSAAANGTPGSLVTNGTYTGQGISVAGFDSGPLFFEQCTGWGKWGVMARPDIPGNQGAIQGLSASIYGTYDWDTASGALTTYSTTTGLRTAGNENWFLIPTPLNESSGDTGVYSNPLTGISQAFWSNASILAIRIVVSTLTGGSVLFSIWATP